MKKFLILTAALGAAVAVLVGLTIQPRRMMLGAAADGAIAGVMHVHTNRSDGSSTPEEVAAAAARAGLQFILFTDHGDGTRTPDPPSYRSGVLCLDGVEISTRGGHYIALDMPPAPYPLGGEARDVVDDVRRLGGFGIVAHPDSPKPELQWRDWDAPFDAIEMVNPDTGWRIQAAQPGWRPKLRLLAALVDYPFRPVETITGLLASDAALPARWAALAARRRVVTTAGADAHARLALRSADPGDSALALPLPGYEPAFRALSVRVRAERPLSGEAARDAQTIVQAIRGGHLHTVIDGIATPGSLELTATHPGGVAREGDELDPRGPVTLHVRTNAPPSFTTSVWNGAALVSGGHHEPEFAVADLPAPARSSSGSGRCGATARRLALDLRRHHRRLDARTRSRLGCRARPHFGRQWKRVATPLRPVESGDAAALRRAVVLDTGRRGAVQPAGSDHAGRAADAGLGPAARGGERRRAGSLAALDVCRRPGRGARAALRRLQAGGRVAAGGSAPRRGRQRDVRRRSGEHEAGNVRPAVDCPGGPAIRRIDRKDRKARKEAAVAGGDGPPATAGG